MRSGVMRPGEAAEARTGIDEGGDDDGDAGVFAERTTGVVRATDAPPAPGEALGVVGR